MTSSPPPSLPQGMSEVDYETIEAAVTETVRGRWFLAEFARRNRGAEVKLMLDAMARLETLVTTQAHNALPPPSSDPSIRLLLQRIKEIAAGLGTTAHAMREADVDASFWQMIEQQARAVAGLMRSGTPPDSRGSSEPEGSIGRVPVAPLELAATEPPRADASSPGQRRLPRVDDHSIDIRGSRSSQRSTTCPLRRS